MFKRPFYFFAILLLFAGCSSSVTDGDKIESQASYEKAPPVATSSGSTYYVLTSTYNSNQWIDLSWDDFANADSYRLEVAAQYDGVTQEYNYDSNEARIFPEEDPSGEFYAFAPNEFGFAVFQVFALDVSGNVIGQSNAISYGIETQTQCAFCNIDINKVCVDYDGGAYTCYYW